MNEKNSTVKNDVVESVTVQMRTLSEIGKNFGAFAEALKTRHAELQNSVPAITDAVSAVQRTVSDAVNRSERAAALVSEAAEKFVSDDGSAFAAWQKEAAKAREQIEGVVGEISANVKTVEESLKGIREAVTELHTVESTVFSGVRDSIREVKDAVERNTRAKVGDIAGALPQTPGLAPEEVARLHAEIADLKTSLAAVKDELLAAQATVPPAATPAEETDEEKAEKFNAGVVADELSEIKSMMFEMIRYMKIVGERKVEAPAVTVQAPEPPPPGTPEELAEKLASGYRDLVKLMVGKKND